MKTKHLSHSDYFAIAIPFIISTVTQPLLGAVDTAVVGHLESPVYIGGVAVGTVILNTLYWLFGFFRVSTTSQSAIAFGKGQEEHVIASLVRPFVLALGVGFVFIVLQGFIWQGAQWILGPETDVAEQARIYFTILIWGAPLVLLNYTVIGWLMGQSKTKATLITQVTGNIINIILDILFVVAFGWGVAGVAVATLIAQFSTLALGLFYVHKTSSIKISRYMAACKLTKEDLRTIISSNIDLLLRTVCLLIMFNLMIKVGASLGATQLASNAVLMQLTFITSYIYDGIANASSVFAGRAVGEKNTTLLKLVFRRNTQWTIGAMFLFTSIILLFGSHMGNIFTDIPEILASYSGIYPWAAVFAFAAGFGLTIYGIFTGTGTTRPVRNATFCALLTFLACLAFFVPLWGNNGLWLSFVVFYIGRGAYLAPYIKHIYAKIEAV